MGTQQYPQLFCYECETVLSDENRYLCVNCNRYACGNHYVPCQECDYNSCSSCMIAHRNEHGATSAVESSILEMWDIHSAILDLVDDALHIARRVRDLIDEQENRYGHGS